MRYLLVLFVFCTVLDANAADDYRGLKIQPEKNFSKYERSKFNHWRDEDQDGEDTRIEVLLSESLTEPIVTKRSDGSVVIQSGLWVGPYTGYVTRDSRTLDIDHMVPLKEAWVSGAWHWTDEERERFANDLTDAQHLIAVKGSAYRSKGNHDPADWMPPNRSYWCQYLNDWVEVKLHYGLSIDETEAKALGTGFRECDRYKSGDALEGRH